MDLEKELSVIKERIQQQKMVVQEIQKIKLAFVSTGQPLEKICKEMFLSLGFKEVSTEINRSDLTLKYGRKDIVVEIKGLSKSAAEKNAAQLEKWVCEHIEKYDVQPKAILLVNAYRNVSLDKRVEEVFPKQMLKYANNREQCLLSTTQFVGLYLDCIKNPNKKKDIIKKFLDTVGIYEEYKDIHEYLEIESN